MNDFKILTATLSKELRGIVKALEVIRDSKGMDQAQFSAFVAIVLSTFKDGFKGDPFKYEDLTSEQKAELLPKKGQHFMTEKDIEEMVKTVHSLIKAPIAGKDFYTEQEKKDFTQKVLSLTLKEIGGEQTKAFNEQRKTLREYFSEFFLMKSDFKKAMSEFKKDFDKEYFLKIARGLEKLKKNDRLDASAIKNLPIPVINNINSIGATSGGSGLSVALEKLTPSNSGNDVTLNLLTLSQTWSVVIAVFKDGQLLDPANGQSGWNRVGNTITVLNTDNTAVFMVEYAYA